ncbi:MAG: AI-2E family transporter [Faecalicoccus sp.]|nr:AI-2E family transporter [Faecalicoccus sp.]
MKQFFTENKRYLQLLTCTIGLIGLVAFVLVKYDSFLRAIQFFFGVLKPFIYGFVIAYLLHPISIRIESLIIFLCNRIFHIHKYSFRLTSIIISFLLLFGIIILLLMAVIPELASSLTSFIASLSNMEENFKVWLANVDTSKGFYAAIAYFSDYIQSGISFMIESLRKMLSLEQMMPTVTSSIGALLGVMGNFLVGCVVAVYLLVSWEKFVVQARLILHAICSDALARRIEEEMTLTNDMFSGFISGKLIDAFIIGCICYVFCYFTKMPYGMLVSVIIGFTNIIPFFGPYFGAIPSALMIFTESPGMCVLFVIFIVTLQQIDGNIIGPKIIGDKMGISSFWILFAILFFGAYWGVVGMIVGVPLFAVLYDMFKRFVFGRLIKNGKANMVEEYEMFFSTPKES